MIIARDLKKHFGAVKAVDGVSFEIADSRITGLLGPNGSGKTTTLRMLYALLQPDAGQVLVDGMDAWHDPLPAKAAMGVVPDARGLYPRLTARENIAYFGELQGIKGDVLAKRIDALAQELEMQDFLERPPARVFPRGSGPRSPSPGRSWVIRRTCCWMSRAMALM